MIRVKVRGSFKKTENFLTRMQKREFFRRLEKYGPIGVAALSEATPKDSSITAQSWDYKIISRPGYFAIHWINTHVEDPGRIPVAILIQYGHATRNGGIVQGQDYINPAIRPIFDQMAADMWREVTR